MNPEGIAIANIARWRSPKVTDDLAASPRALKAAHAPHTRGYSRQSSQALTKLRKDTRTRTHASWFVAISLLRRDRMLMMWCHPAPLTRSCPWHDVPFFGESPAVGCIVYTQIRPGGDTQSKGYILYMGRQPISALNSIPSTYMHTCIGDSLRKSIYTLQCAANTSCRKP